MNDKYIPPADGTRDGTGVWRDGKWHPDPPMKTPNQLCVEAHAYAIEACQLGDEAIKIAFRANGLALNDPHRWTLSRRMLAINHRLKEISEEISHEGEHA